MANLDEVEVEIDIVETKRCTLKLPRQLPKEALDRAKLMLARGDLDRHLQLVSSLTEIRIKEK